MKICPISSLIVIASLAVSVAPAADVLTVEQIAAIDLSDARSDDGWVAPVAKDLSHLSGNPDLRADLDGLVAKLDAWPDAVSADIATRTFVLLNAVSLVDLGRGSCEAEFAWVVFDRLRREVDRGMIRQVAAQIALGIDSRVPLVEISDLGLTSAESPRAVRARMSLHAKKLLLRLADGHP